MKHSLTTTVLLALALLFALQGCSSCEPQGPAEGPRLVEAASDDGCPHPLMPLVEGARWSYKLGHPETEALRDAEVRVQKITRKGDSIVAAVKRTIGQSRTEVEGVCNSDGTSFLAFFVPLGPPLPVNFNFAPQITKRTGALVPPLSKLRAGSEWSYDLVAHTEQPGGRALTMDSNWSTKVSYLGEETITVPAGRYLVKQLKLVISGHHRPPAEEDVVFTARIMDPPPMEFTYSLARGVGVVKILGAQPPESSKRPVRWELAKVDRAR